MSARPSIVVRPIARAARRSRPDRSARINQPVPAVLGIQSPGKSEPAAPKGAAKKLSFKQKFALESLPKKIEAVTASISRLENNIADPAYYERDPASFQKTIAALDQERATLAALEEEWLELEMLREEMKG